MFLYSREYFKYISNLSKAKQVKAKPLKLNFFNFLKSLELTRSSLLYAILLFYLYINSYIDYYYLF
jgi:hypothetical protein